MDFPSSGLAVAPSGFSVMVPCDSIESALAVIGAFAGLDYQQTMSVSTDPGNSSYQVTLNVDLPTTGFDELAAKVSAIQAALAGV